MNRITVVIISMLVSNVWASTTTTTETEESDDDHWYRWLAIYPGTKWCGAGNIAVGYDDLGSAQETDQCCRTHDFCNDTIKSFDTVHNLTNYGLFKMSNCDCDEKFYACLKNANTKTSRSVGRLFFNYLGTKCFRENYPVVRCTSRLYFPRIRCVEYEYNTTKDKVYQWFDVPEF